MSRQRFARAAIAVIVGKYTVMRTMLLGTLLVIVSVNPVQGYSCIGPDLWHIHRKAKTIIYGTVTKHVARKSDKAPGEDIIVQVEEVLRGRVDTPTVTFNGSDGRCGYATAGMFPVGSQWIFIMDGGPVIHVCSGRFLEIDSTRPEESISLDEVKRRLRRQLPSSKPPTKTKYGTPCGYTLQTWLDCNSPHVMRYLESLAPYERGALLAGVTLSDGRRELSSVRYLGKITGISKGLRIYILKHGHHFIAYACIEPGGEPFQWPNCPASKDKFEWAHPGDPGTSTCGLLSGGMQRITVLRPRHGVVRCGCVPKKWVDRVSKRKRY